MAGHWNVLTRRFLLLQRMLVSDWGPAAGMGPMTYVCPFQHKRARVPECQENGAHQLMGTPRSTCFPLDTH